MAAPKKGVAFTVGLNLYTKASQLVAVPSTLTAQTSKDFGAYEAASSASVISTVYGQIKVVLDSTQMNGNTIGLYVRDESTETVPYTATIYTSSNTIEDVAASLSTVAASVALRATSTELSSGLAAQTAILSTMAAAPLIGHDDGRQHADCGGRVERGAGDLRFFGDVWRGGNVHRCRGGGVGEAPRRRR